MVRGVFWSAVQKYSGIVIQLLVSAVLARLLSPSEFGVVALASVLIVFIQLFSDMGLGAAIVQRNDLDEEDYDHLFSFSVYLGVFLALIVLVSSYFVASFYGDELLIPIVQLMAIPLLLGTVNMVPNSLLAKAKRFKFLALRTLAFQVISGVISVVAALLGMGCFSLLISPIFTSFGVLFVNFRQYPRRFHFRMDWSPLKRIFSYSFFYFLFCVSNYFTRNLDKLIIGKHFSMADLGYYEKSYRLMMLPLQQITHVVTPVMHPIFADLQNEKGRMGMDYGKILRLLSMVSFPVGVFLYFAADNLICLVYGSQWIPAIPVFEILTFSVPIQVLIATTGAIYQASGRTDWLFYAGTFHSFITIVGFLLAAYGWGSVEAMAWAFVITMNVHFFISLYVIYCVIMKLSYGLVLKIFVHPVTHAVLLMVLLWGVDLLDWGHFPCLMLQGMVTVLTVLLYYQFVGGYDWRKIVNDITKMKKG